MHNWNKNKLLFDRAQIKGFTFDWMKLWRKIYVYTNSMNCLDSIFKWEYAFWRFFANFHLYKYIIYTFSLLKVEICRNEGNV